MRKIAKNLGVKTWKSKGRPPCRCAAPSEDENPRGYTCPGERFAGAPVTVPGAARCETGRAAMDGHESHNPNQDGEFMAVRLSPKQAVGTVGAGAMRESGQV